MQKCAACQDLPTLQFWSKSDYLSSMLIYPLQRVFYPQNCRDFLYAGVQSSGKNSNCTPLYPQFQNSVGTLPILELLPFLAHLAKGQVSFCHHLASVRRKLSHLNLLLWNRSTKLNQTWQGWSLGGSLSKLCLTASPFIQDGCSYWK